MKAAKARDAVGFPTARLVIEALRELYPEPAYAFLEQVADATGARHHRWADALVMGLWPSRGLGLTGIEVKVSRTDWLRELKDPAKAETIARFCDHWFVAVGNEDIVRDGELPENWGLLVPANTKARIAVKKAAGVLNPQPVTRDFLAAILRQASRLQSGQLWSEPSRTRGRARGSKNTRRGHPDPAIAGQDFPPRNTHQGFRGSERPPVEGLGGWRSQERRGSGAKAH